MIQPQLDQVIAWATGPERQEEILRAKAEYMATTGEFHEEDRSFEQRMAAFLEYFLFDRPLDGLGEPPVSAFLQAKWADLVPEELPRYQALCQSIHGLFEIRKLGTKNGLRLREILSGNDFEIYERRELVALAKGDILDVRLVPLNDQCWVFSGSFFFHPRDARKAILKEAKRRKKADPETPAQAFAWELARVALKFERYRNVPVENIYKFG